MRSIHCIARGLIAGLFACHQDGTARNLETGDGPTSARSDAFLGSKAGDARAVAGIELCWCPAGKFTMGSPPDEPERRPGEDQVEVTLTRGFWMGKYEVTQGQWQRVAGKFPGELDAGEGDDFPIYAINFAEAVEFCAKLTRSARASGELPTDWEFRLPTEAQWEYACRAGTTTATSFGDRLSSKQANFQGKPYNGAEDGPSLKRAARVGSFGPNPWGLHDVHGNVFEWCRDWSHPDLPGGTDPDLSSLPARSRVRRGGCWADEGWPCRSAFRLRFEPERRTNHIGFRVAAVFVGSDDSAALVRLDRECSRSLERLHLPGLAVAAFRDGELIWANGYGFADVEQRIPVTPTTPFNIASLTKPMTSVLLMQLVEKGELSLDESIREYTQIGAPGATIRHVLTMTAESDPPGSAYAYNGNVYGRLSHVLVKKTGWSFRELLVKQILDPLGMKKTVPGVDVLDPKARGAELFGEVPMSRYEAAVAELAKPYRLFGRELVPAVPPPPELSAAANVISTVLDYGRFVAALQHEELLDESTLATVWSANVGPDGSRLPYSLGWFVEDYEGERLVWHHGYWPGDYSALILIVPRVGLSLVAMANSDGLSSPFYQSEGVEGNPLASEFLRAFVHESFPCGPVSDAAVERWEARLEDPPHRAVEIDHALFDRYTGTYRRPNGSRIEILKQEDRLWWRAPAGGPFELFPAAENRFFLKAADYVLTFVSGPDGTITRIDLEARGETVPLSRDPSSR